MRIWIGSGRKNHGQAAATFAHQFEFTALNYNTHGLISQAKLKAKIPCDRLMLILRLRCDDFELKENCVSNRRASCAFNAQSRMLKFSGGFTAVAAGKTMARVLLIPPGIARVRETRDFKCLWPRLGRRQGLPRRESPDDGAGSTGIAARQVFELIIGNCLRDERKTCRDQICVGWRGEIGHFEGLGLKVPVVLKHRCQERHSGSVWRQRERLFGDGERKLARRGCC